MLMPIEAPTLSALPSTVNGRARIERMRCAITAASSAAFRPFHSSTKSSPPSRASVSSRLSVFCSRSATARSSASPAWWPSESFTSLKRSRSTQSTASWARLRAAMRIACPARSVSRARFGRPDSAPRHAAHRLPDDAARLRDRAAHHVAERGLRVREMRFAERHELVRRAAEELVARVAQHRLDALREVGVAPLRVGLPDVLARRVHHVPETLLALGERLARLALLGDVAQHRLHNDAAALEE